jgi:FtsP/CotA-like multicopper oxidase with cupredoxin domain
MRKRTRFMLVLSCVAASAFAAATESLPTIVTNDNHTPGGELHGKILTIRIEIAQGLWHPERDDGPALPVYAFGEVGGPLRNPGPLIRVPQGTTIHASLHNATNAVVRVHGLADAENTGDAGLRVAPGATVQATFAATTPGLFCYWGTVTGDKVAQRSVIDSQLNGAIVVDPPAGAERDEVFVISLLATGRNPNEPSTKDEVFVAAINGKSWPYTKRFEYGIGEPVRWRWVNTSGSQHAMHLHGFYYRVDAINREGHIERYSGEGRPQVVTQRIGPGETFDMTWSPERAGRWVFHCHMLAHMITPLLPTSASATPAGAHVGDHADMAGAGMGQLVLGVTVPGQMGKSATTWHADRKLQLVVDERAGEPRFALAVQDGSAKTESGNPDLLGPPIVLTRGEPVEIEVVNHGKGPTAIHWHGIELESYYDGVAGWSGSASEITPPIAAGTSFTARMVPPRAGTFIYHTHWHDEEQLFNGLYGPLIVVPPGKKFDAKSDLVFIFSFGKFTPLGAIPLVNGRPNSLSTRLSTGKKYRMRLINIAPNNVALSVSLRDTTGPVQWRLLAKDGIDLPASTAKMTTAEFPLTVGETRDVEFQTDKEQELSLDFYLPGPKTHTVQTLVFNEPKNPE